MRAAADVHIGLHGRRDLCGQVYRQVRAAILEGRLLPGQALPSSRELAHRLALARNTVSVAYDRLVAEGLVVARAGVGTFVSAGPRPHGFRARVADVEQFPLAAWRALLAAQLRPRALRQATDPHP